MHAELSHHLGYEKGQAEGWAGKSRKKVQGNFGSVEIAVPRATVMGASSLRFSASTSAAGRG
jgi:transposase-like protein